MSNLWTQRYAATVNKAHSLKTNREHRFCPKDFKEDWRDGSVDKGVSCSCRGPGIYSSSLSVPETPMPSLLTSADSRQTCDTYIYSGETLIYIKNNTKLVWKENSLHHKGLRGKAEIIVKCQLLRTREMENTRIHRRKHRKDTFKN